MIDICFFFYNVDPTVNASYPLSKSIIITNRFFKEQFPNSSSSINQDILEQAVRFLSQNKINDDEKRDSFIPLEKINIIIAISEFGEGYRLNPDFVEDLFFPNKTEPTYFTIVSALYYIKNYPEYISIKALIIKKIKTKLSNLSNIRSDSRLAYTFLDVLSCPFINDPLKQKLLKRYYNQNTTTTLTPIELKEVIETMVNSSWFISWKDIDLLNILEKKELQAVY